MRAQVVLLLAAAFGAAHGRLVERQNTDGGDETSSTPAEESSSSTSPPDEESTTLPPPPESTTSQGDDDQDTTVTRTVTVDGEGGTVTSRTTVFRTSTRTITNTETEVSTTTETREDQETATSTVYETSTSLVRRRDLEELAPRTEAPSPSLPAYAEVAHVTYEELGLRDNVFDKRDTFTVIRTVTDDSGADTTVVNTVTSDVTRTVSEDETTTTVVTETEQINARTTVTTTRTIVVTSTSVNTDLPTTTQGDPNETSNPDQNNDGGDSGLSTGAQAGIGVGAGIGGLAIIGALVWWFMRRRRHPKPDHDDLMGASEVPVGSHGGYGGSGPSTSPGMAEHATAAAFLAPGRTGGNQPNFSAEGYRGTAMGDGRAGYAKPAPYGSAYASAGHSSTSPTTAYSQPTTRSSAAYGDQLPLHPSPPPPSGSADMAWNEPNVAEADTRTPAQQRNVYEMPSQNF